MARKDTDKQINITMSKEDDREFRDFCAAHGMSLNEAFRQARGLLMTDALKNRVPDQAAMINDMLAHL